MGIILSKWIDKHTQIGPSVQGHALIALMTAMAPAVAGQPVATVLGYYYPEFDPGFRPMVYSR